MNKNDSALLSQQLRKLDEAVCNALKGIVTANGREIPVIFGSAGKKRSPRDLTNTPVIMVRHTEFVPSVDWLDFRMNVYYKAVAISGTQADINEINAKVCHQFGEEKSIVPPDQSDRDHFSADMSLLCFKRVKCAYLRYSYDFKVKATFRDKSWDTTTQA